MTAKESSKRWRLANPEYPRLYYTKNKEQVRNQRKKNSRENHKFLVWIKEAIPCADCGRFFSSECMDFDHVRGIKKIKLGQVGANIHSRGSILEELMKCEVVCACCHRTRTRRRLEK